MAGRAANDTHETVAVLGGACFRSAMALDHAGLSNGMRRGRETASAKRESEPTSSGEEETS